MRRVAFVGESLVAFSGFDEGSPIIIRRSAAHAAREASPSALDSLGWALEGRLSSRGSGGAMCASRGSRRASSSSSSPSAAPGHGASGDSHTKAAFGGALAKFRALDSQGVSIGQGEGAPGPAAGRLRDTPSSLEPRHDGPHEGAISDLALLAGGAGSARQSTVLSTVGCDGRLCQWNIDALLNRVALST